MIPFRPDTLQDLETKPETAGDRSLHPAAAPAMDHPSSSPVQVLLPLIRRLLPPGREVGAIRHAQLLAARIEARVVQCRAAVIRTRLGAAAPAAMTRLEEDTAELGRVLMELAESLDAASALVLLDEAGSRPDLDGLLDTGVPELREAALDAVTPGSAHRFDALCRDACIAQIRGAIGRLPLGAVDRAALRQRILEQLPSGGTSPDAGEPAFLDALRLGNHDAALALLSAAALVPRELVAATIGLRNQRGLVSLAWKAGYSMRSAVLLQSQLAGIAPNALLHATADGGCPLGRSEMVWQIGLLSRMSP